MSVLGDILGAVRQVVLLDQRVTSVEADVGVLKAQVHDLAGRLARLDGMFEMAMYHEQRRVERD